MLPPLIPVQAGRFRIAWYRSRAFSELPQGSAQLTGRIWQDRAGAGLGLARDFDEGRRAACSRAARNASSSNLSEHVITLLSKIQPPHSWRYLCSRFAIDLRGRTRPGPVSFRGCSDRTRWPRGLEQGPTDRAPLAKGVRARAHRSHPLGQGGLSKGPPIAPPWPRGLSKGPPIAPPWPGGLIAAWRTSFAPGPRIQKNSPATGPVATWRPRDCGR